LVFFKSHFRDFFKPLNDKLKNKIDEVLFMIRIADRIPGKFFQHLKGTNGLLELNIKAISTESSAVLTKVIWRFFLTGFRRNPKGHLEKK